MGRVGVFRATPLRLPVSNIHGFEVLVTGARGATYPNVGYSHQGLIWDVSDLDDPVLASEFFGATKASDHNLYIQGNTLYQSNYLAGLRVVDISDVSNYPFFESGVIAVTSGSEGLFLVKKKDQRLVP